MAKSKQAQVKEISEQTKREVLERQGYRSPSGASLHGNAEFHHFIFRSSGGVGYGWNIIAVTPDEHRAIHDHKPIVVYGKERFSWNEFQTIMRNHLIIHYHGWSEEKCKYHKFWDKENYHVTPRIKL